MKKYIFTILVSVLLFYPSQGFAEAKEIISEGTYNMGDGETPGVAESRALLQAKRVALEQAGTYVESYSKVINLKLTEDEIKVLASGLMEVEILDKKRTVVGNGIHFWVKIKARVQTEKMEEMAKRVKEKDVIEDYKKVQEAYDTSQKEIEELKSQLSEAKNETEKKKIGTKIRDDERLFQAMEWFNKGYQHSLERKYPRFADKITEAKKEGYSDDEIEQSIMGIILTRKQKALDAGYSEEEINQNIRDNLFSPNSEYDKEIEAYTSAIALNPNFAKAYNNRGIAYLKKGQYDRAIEDYNKAITINPNDAKAYNNRGNAYVKKGQYDRAIEDDNKAITINPNDADAYYNRGNAYVKKGQYDRAIEDYNKAIALDPNHVLAYTGRGLAYVSKGQYDRAIEDYNKAIALDPNHANAYGNRGLAYALKGVMGRAISDFQKACDMGNENGCKGLKMALENR